MRSQRVRVAVIWIDWYPYHVARFRGLDSAPSLSGRVAGIELVGGVGVHAGLKFREELPADLAVQTLMPEANWRDVNKRVLAMALWRKLTVLDPEVVLVPGYYTLPGIAAALWARTHGRVSVLMTESTAGDHPRSWWKEKLKSWLLAALFDWAIAGGKAHVDYLRQLGFPADRVAGSYDVVDNGFFAEGTAALREATPTPAPSFLYVGRLAEEKNVPELMDAWLAYRQTGGTWPLVLVGDGPLRPALEQRAKQSGLGEAIHFAGLRSSAALLPYYAAAGCFVLPSTREPWGLVVNEAMASGLPVLVSDRCGCAPDLVAHGENGMLFRTGNGGAELTRCLHDIAKLPLEERRQMGVRSAERIRNFSPERFGTEIARVADTVRHVLASELQAEPVGNARHSPRGSH